MTLNILKPTELHTEWVECMICEFYLTKQLFLKSKKSNPPTPPLCDCFQIFSTHQMDGKVINGLKKELI